MHLHHIAPFVIDPIGNIRDGRDHVHAEFTSKTFLNDLHVQQSKKSATESKAKRHGTFRLECERRIIELKLLKRRAEVFEIFGFNRIHPGKHHWLHLFKSLDRFVAWVGDVSDSVTDTHFTRCLYT